MSPASLRDCAGHRDNDVDLKPDEVGGDLGLTLWASLRPAILDRHGAPLDPAEFAQSLHKYSSPWAPDRSRGRTQKSDGRHLRRLLRTCSERPCGRATHQRDELASPHSITSSARASSVGGTMSPSALAVLRLTNSSTFVACWTGRSAGFAPARIRPLWMPP